MTQIEKYKSKNTLNKIEKYKIYENFDYTVLEPFDKQYNNCLIFFAGFNENSAKYVFVLKLFFENFNHNLKLKIIIPMSNIYKKEDFKGSPYFYLLKQKQTVYSWYIKQIDKDEFKLNTKPEKDKIIINLINDEIKKLGSSENIILSGFSMGGRYLIEILTKMKIKTKINLVYKSVILKLENPYKYSDDEEKIINQNIFHCFYSKYDEVVDFQMFLNSYQILNREFENVNIKIDNGRHHILDFNCLEHMKNLLLYYLLPSKF